MTPDDKHPQYTEFAQVWKLCRDASTGQRAIHAGGTTYLPKLSGQEDTEYKAYKQRALYVNATGRTVDAMRGLVLRKEPVIEFPESAEDWLQDITLSGITLTGVARKSLEETLKVGRFGILVDHPVAPSSDQSLTAEQARVLNLRPYMRTYLAETILNWRHAKINGKHQLVQVFLEELIEDEPDNKTQIRELSLIFGAYVQILWRKNKDGWYVHDTITPIMQGKNINFIPFWIVAPEESDGDVSNPPIEDIAYINISHYMNSADLENGAHVSGLPTPYITGIDNDGDKKTVVNLGTGTVLTLPDVNSKVGFLQVETGFETLEKLMDRKEQQMAALGARLIAPEKKAAEAAETAGIRRGGENSILGDIAGAVALPIRQALEFIAEWAGLTGDVKFEFNKNFLPFPIDASMLTALMHSWQSGAISEHTFFEALQAGEIINESVTFEDEQERKAESKPPLGDTGNDNDE